jgi:hypothetical protein
MQGVRFVLDSSRTPTSTWCADPLQHISCSKVALRMSSARAADVCGTCRSIGHRIGLNLPSTTESEAKPCVRPRTQRPLSTGGGAATGWRERLGGVHGPGALGWRLNPAEPRAPQTLHYGRQRSSDSCYSIRPEAVGRVRTARTPAHSAPCESRCSRALRRRWLTSTLKPLPGHCLWRSPCSVSWACSWSRFARRCSDNPKLSSTLLGSPLAEHLAHTRLPHRVAASCR